MQRQIDTVLDALTAGADTANEIAAATGIAQPCVNAYLSELRRRGLVRIVKLRGRRFSASGPRSHVYGPAIRK